MILAILLLLTGFGLILAEIFFPSFGVLSVISAGSLIGSVIAAFSYSTGFGWLILLLAILGLPGAIYLAFRLFPRTPIGSRMLSQGAAWSKEERAAVDHAAHGFVGREGYAASSLRPAGIAVFDSDRLDVVTRGEHLEAGTPVRAVRFISNRLVVEELNNDKVMEENS